MTATATSSVLATKTVLATPCVPWSDEGRHCIAGLLHGVACCPDGGCALCRATADRMRASGFSEAAVWRGLVRMRRGLLDTCPTCGFPPPPPVDALPQLTRLDRSDRVLAGSSHCRICGTSLGAGKRHYCSKACWLQRRRATEGWGEGVADHEEPRVRKVRLPTR